MNKFYNSLKME